MDSPGVIDQRGDPHAHRGAAWHTVSPLRAAAFILLSMTRNEVMDLLILSRNRRRPFVCLVVPVL
jgi:hypothetical protein